MKILFATQTDADFYGPIGLTQISAMAKKRGDETYLTILSKENVMDKIAKINPEVVAYSSTTGEHKFYTKTNKLIKLNYPEIFTIMGGPHPTFFPEVLEEANLDAICIGEGESAFIDLLECLENKKDISNLENIVVRGKKPNKLRPLLQNLDTLPFPDRALFYDHDKTNESSPVMNFMTLRGCSYSCPYCFNEYFRALYPKEKYLRRHSVDYVINEILDAKKLVNFKFIRFVDDIFVFNEGVWFNEFCEKYPKKVGLPFYVHSRFDLMTPNIASLLKKANCQAILMSIESANEKIRNDILKRNMSDEQIINGAKACLNDGPTMVVNTMLGLPTSTIEDDINAVDFTIKTGAYVADFPIFQPYPGTRLYELCREKSWLEKEASKMDMYGLTHKSVLNCFSEKEKDIQKNIMLLGPMVVRHPGLRDLVMNQLIYMPPNFVFKNVYTFGKLMTYQSKVYRMEYSLRERLNVIKRALKLEKVKRN